MKVIILFLFVLVLIQHNIASDADDEENASLPIPIDRRQTATSLKLLPPAPGLYPYGLYPWLKPGKFPFLYPPYPMLTPDMYSPIADTTTDSKKTARAIEPPPEGKPINDETNEFLENLFELSPEDATAVKRQATPTDATPAPETVPLKPLIDPTFFITKKYDFLTKLFAKLNSTTTPAPDDPDSTTDPTATTVKPSIVPPDFWVPFPFLVKPSKAPKPPKPVKVKDSKTLISKITLADLIDNPSLLDSVKRSVPVPPSKPVTVPLDYYIPTKLDPVAFSDKFSAYLNKVFTKLNKTDPKSVASGSISPKATVIPAEFYKPSPPSPDVYSSQVEAFLDILFKSLDANVDASSKTSKSKRSFFSDLFKYTSPTKESTLPLEPTDKLDAVQTMIANDLKKRTVDSEKEKSLDEIQNFLLSMDTLYNQLLMFQKSLKDGTVSKRSITNSSSLNTTGLTPQQAAASLILTNLGSLKNDLIVAYGEVIAAQAAPAKPTPPPSKTKAKVPVWAKFKVTTTENPIAPIQKRIDLINSVFDMLTEIEQDLVSGQVSSDSPSEASGALKSTSTESATTIKPSIVPPDFWVPDPTSLTPPDSSYYLIKTQEFLSKLYESRLSTTEATPDDD